MEEGGGNIHTNGLNNLAGNNLEETVRIMGEAAVRVRLDQEDTTKKIKTRQQEMEEAIT